MCCFIVSSISSKNIIQTTKKRNHEVSFARGEKNYHTDDKVKAFLHVVSFVFQVISVVLVLYLFGNSEAGPFPKQLMRIMQRERRQVKLITASSKRCNQTLQGSGRYTSTSDVSLLYKNGWFLAVYSDGNINGTSDARSPDSE